MTKLLFPLLALCFIFPACQGEDSTILGPPAQVAQEETRDFIIDYTGSECVDLVFTVVVDFTDNRPVEIFLWTGLIPSFVDTFTVATAAFQLDYSLHLLHDIRGTILKNIVPLPAEGTPTLQVEVLQPGCFGTGVTAEARMIKGVEIK